MKQFIMTFIKYIGDMGTSVPTSHIWRCLHLSPQVYASIDGSYDQSSVPCKL
jgi:hypothetical protein